MKMALFVLLLCVLRLPACQQAEQQPPNLPPAEEAKRPDIPTLQPDPTDPEQKAQREARSSLFTMGGLLLPLNTTGHFHTLAIVDLRPMAELPVDEDVDAIVVGKIVDKKIFATQRKRGLYTEYTLKIECMLRPLDKLNPDSRIAILRPGGLAKGPGGGTLHNEIRGIGPDPAIGSEYLFFLRYFLPPADAYTVFKFWNVVTQADGSRIVKAAFDQDLYEARNKRSNLDCKSLSDVEATIQSSQ